MNDKKQPLTQEELDLVELLSDIIVENTLMQFNENKGVVMKPKNKKHADGGARKKTTL